jgi:hypothetical protein
LSFFGAGASFLSLDDYFLSSSFKSSTFFSTGAAFFGGADLTASGLPFLAGAFDTTTSSSSTSNISVITGGLAGSSFKEATYFSGDFLLGSESIFLISSTLLSALLSSAPESSLGS